MAGDEGQLDNKSTVADLHDLASDDAHESSAQLTGTKDISVFGGSACISTTTHGRLKDISGKQGRR